MINYDDDPRYEFVEEGVYFDTQTNETVIVLDDEAAAMVRQIIEEDQGLFEVIDDDNVRLTDVGAEEIIEPYLDKLYDSDLNEL